MTKKRTTKKSATTTKNYPTYAGVVQDETLNEVGRIALWRQNNTNVNYPVYVGFITTTQGRRYRVALWDYKPADKQSAGL
ncbi:MAG: hypothetical protein QW175_02780 [Candidatus Bathyarchaeia archaeon]